MEWSKIPTDLLVQRLTDNEMIAIIKYQSLWALLEHQPDDKTALRYMTHKQLIIAKSYQDSIKKSVTSDIDSINKKRTRQKKSYEKQKVSKNSDAPDKIREDKIREDNIHTSSDKSSDVCRARASKINEILEKHGLSKIKGLTSQRQQKLRDRIKSAGSFENFLQELDKALAESSFLRGEAKSDWKADFDFFLSPQKWQKVVEGTYADKKEVKHYDWEDIDFKDWEKW